MMRPDQSSTAKKRTLTLYSLAAGAGALASGGLAAAVVDTGLSGSVSVSPGSPFAEFGFDVTGDGVDDFRLSARVNSVTEGYCGQVQFEPQGGSAMGVAIDQDFEDDYYAALIAAGDQVSDELSFRSYQFLFGSCYPSFSSEGNFPPDTRGFVGFQLAADPVALGKAATDFFYGYADVEVTSSGIGLYTATVHGIFYENQPNVPIQVPGGTEPIPYIPVPVGGAVPLGLLLLASGAFALRRRQQRLAKD